MMCYQYLLVAAQGLWDAFMYFTHDRRVLGGLGFGREGRRTECDFVLVFDLGIV